MQIPDPGDAVVIAIDRLAAALTMAAALVGSGREVDLAGLDAEVGAVCADAVALPEEQAKACVPALSALLGRVDVVHEAMQRARPPD